MAERICIGYGEREGACTNVAGTPWTPLWCSECDEERRATISRQLAFPRFEPSPEEETNG